MALRLLACAAVIAAALAASPPVFPDEFSSGIRLVEEGVPRSGEWYWSVPHKADRLDFVHEEAKIIEINDYSAGKRYTVIQPHHGGESACEVADIPKDMPAFNFSGYDYAGSRMVHDIKCDVWQHKTASTTFSYIDEANTTNPVELSRTSDDHHNATDGMFFNEFHRGAQPASLFNVSTVYNGQCKPRARVADDVSPAVEIKPANASMPGCSPLSCDQMKALVKAHFPGQYQTDMICIAHYESSWCPDVYNGVCCYGLWQINANHVGDPGCPKSTAGLEQADPNASCALHVLQSQGLNAWTTWANGDCRHWSGCSV